MARAASAAGYSSKGKRSQSQRLVAAGLAATTQQPIAAEPCKTNAHQRAGPGTDVKERDELSKRENFLLDRRENHRKMQHQLAQERKRRLALEAEIEKLRGSLGQDKRRQELTEALVRGHEASCAGYCRLADEVMGEGGTEILK